jgi:polar amino acid transport system substrate-binding protein
MPTDLRASLCQAWSSWAAFFCLLGLNGFTPLSAQQVLTLACEDKTDFPNVLGDSQEIDWKKPGASIEFVMRLGEELNFKVVIKRIPWKRALELELKSGTIDGLFPASYKTEREAYGGYPMKDGKVDDSRSMFVSSYFFYKLKTSNLEWDGKALKNLIGPIGASRGYSVVGDLQQMGYQVQESDDVRKDLKRLSDGRLGAIAGLESAEDFLLETSPDAGKDITKVQPPISRKHYFLMLSKQFLNKNPELAQRIWDKTRELRDKELPGILRKYMTK